MALTTVLEIETHPSGTVGLNGVVNGNWNRLEKVFGAVETLGSSGSINLDANEERSKALDALTGNVTFTTSNLVAGRHLRVRIPNGGTLRTLAFPAGWNFLGANAPASIDANKVAVLELSVWGSTDSDVDAVFSVEP